ncbi:MAG TPA: hypothetical protein VNJ31_09660 [Methyloceanibacter sp.]|nr:hypothetical protein [Methyloceanibacter sp.]
MAGKRAAFDEARARNEYEHGYDSLAVIAARHGISRSTLLNRTKEGGWLRKHKPVKRPRRSQEEMRAERFERATRLLRQNIVGRLFVLIDQKLKEIEKRMQDQAASGTQSAADTERDARSFHLIMQVYGKVVELDEAARKNKTVRGGAAGMTKEDADRLRRELAQRIARLGGTQDD